MSEALAFITLALAAAYLGVIAFFYFLARQGRMRSAGAGIALVAALALLAVIPTELVSIAWIGVLQRHVEVTANLFILIPAPIVAAVIAIQALALARVYRARPLLLASVHLGVFAAAYAFWLSRLFNPPADIARYVVVILLVGSAVFGLAWHFVWRRQTIQKP